MYKVFTVVPATGVYSWPVLGAIIIPGGAPLAYGVKKTGITAYISGGNSEMNTKEDFSVHI